jgi:hypothetical protein
MTNFHHRGASPVALIAVIACACLQILTPLLPDLGIGRPIGSQSDAVRTLLTPAGWAFSIWGALYAGSIAFALFQLLPAQRRNALLAPLRWPAAGAFLGNSLWAAYTQIFGLSAISAAIILWTLTCLLVIYRRISSWDAKPATAEIWFVVVPLSALAAWLTAASIVNIGASLRFHGIEASVAAVPLIGAAVLLLGGAIAALAVARGNGNLAYAATFLWALAGIYAAGGQAAAPIGVAAMLAAMLVLGGIFAGRRHAAKRAGT